MRPVNQAADTSTSSLATSPVTPSPPPPPPPVGTVLSPPPPPPPLPKGFDIRSTESTLRRPGSLGTSNDGDRSETSSNADTDETASSTSTTHSEERTLPRLFERPMSFIPPQFMQPPDSDTNLKPSEYLKTVSNKPKSHLAHKDFKEQLQNVQLKRTDKPSTLERCVLLQKSPCSTLAEQKSTIIEELKQSIGNQGVHGVRKLKEERQRLEEEKEKKKAEELLQQIKATNFVDAIPEKDSNGCVIPAWKRQMLAKKAADKARKEAEEALQREAEAKKWTSVPAWKRQLLMKNGDATLPINRTLGPKPLTGTLSCPAAPVSSAPSSATSTPASTSSKPENGTDSSANGNSEPVSPASSTATSSSLVIAEEDKPQNPFLQHGLRKVNVRLH
ncbi:hypothetical protein HPB51_019732 [Rhipicephalus microplus]|uniref:Uncharacterized protein n=1 Tax=Rhipicephalus microplus TaxID=6941 RepID=A0A9J6F670_RHIMP|nr:hypothetical protein HPB51_019732 [Rhipicephalus microplus]